MSDKEDGGARKRADMTGLRPHSVYPDRDDTSGALLFLHSQQQHPPNDSCSCLPFSIFYDSKSDMTTALLFFYVFYAY